MSSNQTARTAPWDAADLLDSPKAIAAYRDAAVEEVQDDPGFLLTAARSGRLAS